MKAKSMVIPLVVLLVVLASSVAPAEAKVTVKVRKVPIGPYPPGDLWGVGLGIVGWLSYVYGEEETPQGTKWHLRWMVQFDVINLTTGEYLGKGRHIKTNNGLIVDDVDEDIKIEENAVVNIPGLDMQGIERRKKILSVIVNEVVKLDVYIDVIAF